MKCRKCKKGMKQSKYKKTVKCNISLRENKVKFHMAYRCPWCGCRYHEVLRTEADLGPMRESFDKMHRDIVYGDPDYIPTNINGEGTATIETDCVDREKLEEFMDQVDMQGGIEPGKFVGGIAPGHGPNKSCMEQVLRQEAMAKGIPCVPPRPPCNRGRHLPAGDPGRRDLVVPDPG